MINGFTARMQQNYMRRFRALFLISSTSISLTMISLAILAHIKYASNVAIFIGLVLTSMLNIGISILIKVKILDVLVELEQVLSESSQMQKNSTQAQPVKLPRKKNPGALNKMVEQIEKSINNEYTSQLLRTQAEIHALQSQINPHFLYNTLETIRSQAIIRNVPEIEEMSEALATIFRYGISSQGEMSTLAKELKCADNYLLIQQYRFKGRYKIIKDIDESNDTLMNCRMPILTIQPIIENAIVHGLERKLDPGTITIRAQITNTHVYIQIYDDGIGMQADVLERLNKRLESGEAVALDSDHRTENSGTGIAMINVNQRIKHFFGQEYGLSVSSTIDIGTYVEIVLPNQQ